MAIRGLFVGIDDYPFEPLSSCVNDAVAMRNALVKLGILTDAECTLMTYPAVQGSAEVPTRSAILDVLLPIYELQEPLDKFFFYYSGHGLSVRLGREADTLRTVIVPVGVKRLENSGGSLLDLDEILGRFKRRGAKEQFWIVDACRNVPTAGLNVATIGWDSPQTGDPRDAELRGQAVIYAVAPLAKASANKGGHGHLTENLLDGLNCTGPASWGASATFDDGKDSWVIDCDSLVDYAARRIELTLPEGDWQREYKRPRVWFGEKRVGPLRDAGSIDNRPFELTVVPSEAAAAVAVSLSVRRATIAAWPPKGFGDKIPIAPERYRLNARLVQDDGEWLPPIIPNPVIDIREIDSYALTVMRRPPDSGGGDAASLARIPDVGPDTPRMTVRDPAPSIGSFDLQVSEMPTPAITRRRRAGIVAGKGDVSGNPTAKATRAEVSATTMVSVDATDPGASIRMTRLSGQRQQIDSRPGEWTTIAPGLWRIEVLIGDDIIAASEEDFAAKTKYTISTSAQITPALTALLTESGQPPPLATFVPSLQPSEAIGPMQGAILPTLLPLLALKPFDANNLILRGLTATLNIPRLTPVTDAPAAIAIALEGLWTDAQRVTLSQQLSVAAGGPASLVWMDSQKRILLFVQFSVRTHAGIRLTLPGIGAIDIAAPRVSGYCATASITVWPDRIADVSFNLFLMPPGADATVKAGRLARALTLAARLLRTGTTLDQVHYDVFEMISYGSWGDPVLGAMAWIGRWKRFQDGRLDSGQAADLTSRQFGVHAFLVRTVPLLPDTRVIDALNHSDLERDAALDALLADPTLDQPVLTDSLAVLARRALATGRADHWSVMRFQQLKDPVFNAIQTDIATRGGT